MRADQRVQIDAKNRQKVAVRRRRHDAPSNGIGQDERVDRCVEENHESGARQHDGIISPSARSSGLLKSSGSTRLAMPAPPPPVQRLANPSG